MDQTQQPQQRELVFCHECENEWYRHEHGIICPECQSDFTEILEAPYGPRQDDDASSPQGGPHGFFAPDPDEDDIDDPQWHQNWPGHAGGGQLPGQFPRDNNIGATGQQGAYGMGGGGIFGLLAPVFQGWVGGQHQQTPHGDASPDFGDANPYGAPGSPWDHNENPEQPHQHEQQSGNGGSFVRHVSGPGYSFTITTSSNGNLFPRNAYGPQQFQHHPDNLNQMMAQMFANIGVMPGQGFGGPGGMHGGSMHGGNLHGGPMFMEIGGGPHGGGPGISGPFANLFQALGIPPGGLHGDAVYSQEALDRVISQLMEQHQSGNAPPPASSEAIESLPKRAVTEKDLGENGKADCSICMDDAELGSTVTELPCGHWFHFDCIKAWLGEHDTCPHCRQGITPKDNAGTDGRARQPREAALHDVLRDHFTNNEQSRPGSSRPGPSTHPGGESSGSSLFGRLRQTFSPSSRNQHHEGGTGPPGT